MQLTCMINNKMLHPFFWFSTVWAISEVLVWCSLKALPMNSNAALQNECVKTNTLKNKFGIE